MRYFLELCLKSVQAAVKDLDAEIIVVDNQSTDESCDMVKQLFPDVVLIENTNNYGFSKGNNIGVSKAKGEYICILNPDTVVAEDTFIKVLQFADSQSNLGAVGCKLIDGTGKFLPESKRNVPTPNVALQKLMGHSKSYYANHIEPQDVAPVQILVGAFMLIKKEVYNQVGGFDDDYFMYGEDVDLSYKILKAGFQNQYFGATTVIHFKGESTFRNKTYAKRFNGAMKIFYKKHFKPNFVFNVGLSLGVKVLTMLNMQPEIKTPEITSRVLVSHRNIPGLEQHKNLPCSRVDLLTAVKPNQLVFLDNTHLSFKTIIAYLEKYQFNNAVAFRIIPYNANFAVGSDHAAARGEIIKFST